MLVRSILIVYDDIMEYFVGLENALKDSYVIAGQPKHLLLGLSGGADSIALAKLLNSLQKTCEFELTCVHVNHGLRKSADEDEQFVIQTCKSWKIPLIVKHVNISSAGNIESKAREVRYKAFYEAKAELSANCLVLAHHMDDQAETIMMRLMHGTGPTGLAAMREFSRDIWRPLLQVRRNEIIDFLQYHSIGWREDETNLDFRFFRNEVRHKLLPVLEELAPSSISNMTKTSVIFADEEDYWSQYTERWLYDRASLNPANTFLNLQDFDTLHIAVKRRVLRCFCAVLDLKPDMFQLERLIELSRGSAQQSINLPRGVKAFRCTQRLHLVKPKRNLIELGSTQMTELEKNGSRRIESFDSSGLLDAVLRYRLPGDRITPLGSGGTQSLSKYLIDRRMDQPFRDHWPLLTRDHEVLWVVGFGMAQTAAIKADTNKITNLLYKGNLPDETESEKKGQ